MEDLTNAYLEAIASALSKAFVPLKDFKALQSQVSNLGTEFILVTAVFIVVLIVMWIRINKLKRQHDLDITNLMKLNNIMQNDLSKAKSDALNVHADIFDKLHNPKN